MAHINRSDLAETDLLEIGRYIARDNIDAALQLLDRIDEKCKMLAGNPLLGEVWHELGENIRHFTVRPYVIIYLSPDGKRDRTGPGPSWGARHSRSF